MAFIQRDDMVEDLPAGTSDPAFGDSILPGSLHACPFRLQANNPGDNRSGEVRERYRLSRSIRKLELVVFVGQELVESIML